MTNTEKTIICTVITCMLIIFLTIGMAAAAVGLQLGLTIASCSGIRLPTTIFKWKQSRRET